MGVQGDVVTWVADHRKHHQFSDREGDPHSPHAGHGDGVLGGVQGPLARAPRAGCSSLPGAPTRRRYAKDLVQDRGMRVIATLCSSRSSSPRC